MRELMLNKKLFEQSFHYTRHFLIERMETSVFGKRVELPVLYRLSYKNSRLFITKGDAKKPMVSRGNDHYQTGDWITTVPTGNKEQGTGLVLNEFNLITNLLTQDTAPANINKLKRLLTSKGLPIEFTPCHKCGTAENLTLGDDDLIICESCKEVL
jgi:hypothetical protein